MLYALEIKHKAVLALGLMLVSIMLVSGNCFALEGQESDEAILIEQQENASGVEAIKDELERYMDDENNELLQGFTPEELIRNVTAGDLSLDLKGIGGNALHFLFRELYQNLGIFVKLAVLAVICALLKNLKANFLGESVGQVAFYVCYIVTVSILLVSYGTVVKMGTDIIDKMVGFMYVTIPVMIALLISGGNITTGGILHPVLLLIVEGSVTLIKNIFIPLVFLSTILRIVNNISDKIQLVKLANLLKQIVSWALVTILTVFVIAISLQGSLGAVIDGVTSKAAKFAISTFIPIVGKTLADATDTVIGCTLLIKNATSVAALVGILVICIVPLIKIIAMVVLYKAASALLEPISEKRITNCIDDVAGSMLQIFALTAAVAFMFMISITALISAGNVSAMLR